MSRFDEEPDGEPHGECAAEIADLKQKIAEIEAERDDWKQEAMAGRVILSVAALLPEPVAWM